ncbi:MAG: metal ABC transporter ATP-binding protein [Thermofilaceae archaeon]
MVTYAVHIEQPSVKVVDLTFAYNSEYILTDENLELWGPGLITLLGPNGAGKTTFFKLLLGILKPFRGRVYLNGEDVTGNPLKAGVHASLIPQLASVRKDLPVTGYEFVELALRGRGVRKLERKEKVEEALSLVRATDFAEKRISSMSGGQLQRILIARAIAAGTPILVMDEPFSGIDPRGREDISKIIEELGASKLVILSTHDPVFTLNRSKLVVVFNKGVKGVGAPEEVYKLDLLRAAYGPGMLLIEKCLHVLS